MTRMSDMIKHYYNILINLGIYTDIDESQFDIIYKRYRDMGGYKDLSYDIIKRRLRRKG